LALACDAAAGEDARCFTSTFQFLRGAREQDLHAIATILSGASIATVTVVAWQDDQGRPVATAYRKYRFG
jgi:acyl-coenzyme A thioesterase PaaI-like protein